MVTQCDMQACLYSQGDVVHCCFRNTNSITMFPELHSLELSIVHNVWQSWIGTEINYDCIACGNHIVAVSLKLHQQWGSYTLRTCVNTDISMSSIPNAISMIQHF